VEKWQNDNLWQHVALNSVNNIREMLETVGTGCVFKREWLRQVAVLTSEVESLRGVSYKEIARQHPRVAFVPTVAQLVYQMFCKLLTKQHRNVIQMCRSTFLAKGGASAPMGQGDAISALFGGRHREVNGYDPLRLIETIVSTSSKGSGGVSLIGELGYDGTVAALITLADMYDEALLKHFSEQKDDNVLADGDVRGSAIKT